MVETENNIAGMALETTAPLPASANPLDLARTGDGVEERVLSSLDHAERLAKDLRDDDAGGRSTTTGCLVSVIIPVYNEEKTILDVVERVLALPLETEIIIVDDASTDDTPERLATLADEPNLRVVRHATNQGKGAAIRTGLSLAGGDIVTIQDADLEYDPAEIPRLVEPILRGEYDVVYGSRYLKGSRNDSSLLHRFGNALLTRLSNAFTGQRLTDMETCYKAFRRNVLDGIEITQDRFGVEPELTAKVARRKCVIHEIPISYHGRGYGDGKKIGVRDGFRALYCIVRHGLWE